MGSFLEGLEGRVWLAMALIIGLGVLLIGEFYLLAAFPGGKRWLGSWMGKAVIFLFYFLLYVPSFIVFIFWMNRLYEPEFFAPLLSNSTYFISGLLYGVSAFVIVPALMFFWLTFQLTKRPLAQPSALPTFHRSTLFWYPFAGLMLGLFLGFLFGALLTDFGLLTGKLIANLFNDPSSAADAAMPLWQRPLVFTSLGAGGSFGLLSGLMAPFNRWLQWWKNGGLWKPSPRIAAVLIGVGCVIVAVSAWLIG